MAFCIFKGGFMTWALLVGALIAIVLYLLGIFETAVDPAFWIPKAVEIAFIVMGVVAFVSIFLRVLQ